MCGWQLNSLTWSPPCYGYLATFMWLRVSAFTETDKGARGERRNRRN